MTNNSLVSGIVKKQTKAGASNLLYFSLRNFFNHKLRSSLTVLGVVIGSVAVFFLASFGLGVHSLVSQQIIGEKSLQVIDVSSPNSKVLKLSDQVVNTIKGYPHIKSVGVQSSFPGVVGIGSGESDTVVYGVDERFQEMESLSLKSGRLLTATDHNSVLVSSAVAKLLSGKKDSEKSVLGSSIKLTIPIKKYSTAKDKIVDNFSIVGVIDSDLDNEVYLPVHVLTIAGVSSYSGIKVKIDDSENISAVRKQIEANGFETSSLADTMQEINNIFKFLNWILIGFGSIGTIVAVLGMFNTLTISLVERTKEIGLMMSLGARRVDVRQLFMFDAVVISALGSAMGVTVAYFVGKAVNYYINIGAQARGVAQEFSLFATPPWLFGLVILATVLLGLSIAYLPARRASRINPINALRRE